MTSTGFDFGPMLDSHIARFTVGFVDVTNPGHRPIGSGTLVKTSATQGILTCAHVLRVIQCHTQVGICLFPIRSTALQVFRLTVAHCAPPVLFEDLPSTANGRDLAYLPLPVLDMASLTASASVVDLEFHEARHKEHKPEGTCSVEAIAGVVEQLTPPAFSRPNHGLVLPVEGLINVGRFVKEWKHNQFDLLEFQPIPGPGFVAPTTYGATSGGGMWRLYVKQQPNGTYEPAELRLVGAVFWETNPSPRKLIGHGPISVFGHLLTEVRRRWP